MLDVAVQAEGWPEADWEGLAGIASTAALRQSPYGEWLDCSKALLGGLSPQEQSAVFEGNAARAYRTA